MRRASRSRCHDWPGNVRELENRVQRAVILVVESALRPEDLELGEAPIEKPRSLQDARDETERRLVEGALRKNAGNVTRAARDLDVNRATLHDLLRKHGLDAGQFRRPGPADEEDEISDGPS